MPLPGIRAATSFLDELQRDLLETEDQDFDGLLDRWAALGVPEVDDYRGERRRGRGEVISEVNKTRRAIEKRPEILLEEEAGETPIMTGVRRIARGADVFQGLMENAGAPRLTPISAAAPGTGPDVISFPAPEFTPAAAPGFSPEPLDFETETGDTPRLTGFGETGELVEPAPAAAPFSAKGGVNALTQFGPVGPAVSAATATAILAAGPVGFSAPMSLAPAEGSLANPVAGQSDDGSSLSVEMLDRTFLPAELPDDESIGEFQAQTGFGLERSDGGFQLTDQAGRQLFELPEDAAAELARIWTPEFGRRATTLGVIWREDLSPEQKQQLVEEMIAEDLSAAESMNVATRAPGRGGAFARARQRTIEGTAAKRLAAYGALTGALERGALDEELQGRIDDWQEAMLPEAFGSGRIVRDLVMDLLPGLGNVRSIRHLENEFAEIDRAVETGEWGDAAFASGMAILDAIGIVPGGNIVKGLGRGTVKVIPHASGLLAERSIQRLKRQWGTEVSRIDSRRFFGDAFEKLPPNLQKNIKGLVSNRVGDVSEDELLSLGRRMDPNAAGQVRVNLPVDQGFPTKTRRFDMDARFRSDMIAEKSAVLGRLARWALGAEQRAGDHTKALIQKFELKTGPSGKPPRESMPDEFFRNDPDAARAGEVFGDIHDLRKAPEEVSMKFVINDLSKQMKKWVEEGRLPQGHANALQQAMKQIEANGVERIRLDDYAGFLARLGAAALRRQDGGTGDMDDEFMAAMP